MNFPAYSFDGSILEAELRERTKDEPRRDLLSPGLARGGRGLYPRRGRINSRADVRRAGRNFLVHNPVFALWIRASPIAIDVISIAERRVRRVDDGLVNALPGRSELKEFLKSGASFNSPQRRRVLQMAN